MKYELKRAGLFLAGYIGFVVGVELTAWWMGIPEEGWPGWAVAILSIVMGFVAGLQLEHRVMGPRPGTGKKLPFDVVDTVTCRVGSLIVVEKGVTLPNCMPCDGRELPVELYPRMAAMMGAEDDTFRLPVTEHTESMDFLVKVR